MHVVNYLSLLFLACVHADIKAPNIVFVLMDDLGWHDVSYNGGQFPTPNIDSLWADAVELNRHYIHLMCSPSRTQFLTGRYAMRQGIGKMLPWDYTEIGGIPVGQPTVANWLKVMSNYSTYAVGKWHCGYAYEGLLPTNKGFDHFFGFYQGAIHYGDMKYIDIKFGDSNHYDFWEDEDQVLVKADDFEDQLNTMYLYRDKVVQYIEKEAAKRIVYGDKANPFYMYIPLQTIHGPLERVHEYEAQCDEILGGNIPRRSKYCQNMLLSDDVIGKIMNTLKDSGLWENTLFVLTTDNGADIANKGCNFPLRGTKGTLFDGNLRTIALVGGGIIPTPQRGTYRDALVSSLDWTPTLLHYAHALNRIQHNDKTWDGEDQHDLIMKGVGVNDEHIKRDHIVFNIGLRNLDSASLVFEKDNHLYKYIAQDGEVDQWLYKREDGWCVPEKNGDWNMIMDADISLAQHVDNKYLFDLTYDVSERTNLLQLTDQDEDNQELVEFAKQILTEYTHHSLYSEHLPFLWNRLAAGDPALFGEGSFVAPFLTESEYFRHLAKGFGRIEEHHEDAALRAAEKGVEFTDTMPYTKKLKALYFHKWEAPAYAGQRSATWYIYTIIGIVIVALIVIVIVSVARWRHLKSFYNDGYEPIKGDNTKRASNEKEQEAKRLLKDSNDSDEEEEENTNDSAQYIHVDSNRSQPDINTALITVEN